MDRSKIVQRIKHLTQGAARSRAQRGAFAALSVAAGVAAVWLVGAGWPRVALASSDDPPSSNEAPPPPGDVPPPPEAAPAPGRRDPAPEPPPRRTYRCPVDGAEAAAKGADGRDTTRRDSDLEMPTRAYSNLVVVCPSCGYAAWAGEFERMPPPEVADYARSTLKRSARSAGTDAAAAYQHLMNVLHVRRADFTEQIAAALYFTYVLKRQRPYGGLDPALERKIVAARKRTVGLLNRALRDAPPKLLHARLEWTYLVGELTRLGGDTQSAATALRGVCEQQREAGFTMGRLACEMAQRAERGESWEDFRDGVFDVRGIEAAERDATRRRAEVEKERAEAERAKAEADKARAEADRQRSPAAKSGSSKGTAHAQLPNQPSSTDDPYAPPLPPVAR